MEREQHHHNKCSILRISDKVSFKISPAFPIENTDDRSCFTKCANPTLTSTSPTFEHYMKLAPEIKDMITKAIFKDAMLPAYNFLLAIEPLKNHHAYAKSLLEDVVVSSQSFTEFKKNFKNRKYMGIRSLSFKGCQLMCFRGHPMTASNNLSCILLDLQEEDSLPSHFKHKISYQEAVNALMGGIGWLWTASRIGIFEFRIKFPAPGNDKEESISLLVDHLNKAFGVQSKIEERNDNSGGGYTLLWKKAQK